MPIKYRIVPFQFDTILFSHILREIPREDVAEFAQVIGVSYSLMRAWQNGRYDDEFPYPSMSNFIAACNWLDLDPTIFFSMKTCDHENTEKKSWGGNGNTIVAVEICAACGQTVKYQIIERSPKSKGEGK